MVGLEEFRREWESESDFIEAHTSGSTGTPKPIRLRKADMLASARATNKKFGINPSSVLANPLSLDYIAGKMMFVRAWDAKCELISLPITNDLIIDRHVDLLAIVPSQVAALLKQPSASKLIRNLIIGGAPLSPTLSDELTSKGFNAFTTYGMTETCSHVALSNLKEFNGKYVAMPGISFEQDERECLIINAPSFSFKKLVTNDIVRLIDKTSFYWIGRYDNVINSGGIKISPEALEKEIATYFNGEFYITSQDDERWGEVPVMIFEGSIEQEKGILERLRQVIDHKRCPKQVKAVNKLPRTSNGKIKRYKMI